MTLGAGPEEDCCRLAFLWLEITAKCQLECAHCYAESAPQGTHGVMVYDDWLRVIDEAVAIGVGMVQFIGGEPTLHPGLPDFVDYALIRGLSVEVFTNLVHVPRHLWRVFGLPGVRLATSYPARDGHGTTRQSHADHVQHPGGRAAGHPDQGWSDRHRVWSAGSAGP